METHTVALTVALIALTGVLASAAVQLIIGLRTSRAARDSAAAATTASRHAGGSSAAAQQAADAATATADASTRAAGVAHRAEQTLDLWRQREETFRIIRWASDHALAVDDLARCLTGLGSLDAIVQYPIVIGPDGLNGHRLQQLDLQFVEAARQAARQAIKQTLLAVVEVARRRPSDEGGNAAIAAQRSLQILERFPDLEVSRELGLVNEMRARYGMSMQDPGREVAPVVELSTPELELGR